jgi:hypothetical protein
MAQDEVTPMAKRFCSQVIAPDRRYALAGNSREHENHRVVRDSFVDYLPPKAMTKEKSRTTRITPLLQGQQPGA